MNFFLQINEQVKGKNSQETVLTKSAQIFFYACLSFRLSPQLIIARRILKLINNIPYSSILKSPFLLIFKKDDFC